MARKSGDVSREQERRTVLEASRVAGSKVLNGQVLSGKGPSISSSREEKTE